MRKEIKNIDVKELVQELNELDKSSGSSSKKKTLITEGSFEIKTKKEKKDNEYEYVFVSGCDFAINRKTLRTDKTLVMIYSKKIFYIYDELKEQKTLVTEPTQIKRFFSDKLAGDYVIEPEIIPYAKNGILKSDIDQWYGIITNTNPGIQYLIKRGLIDYKLYSNWYERYLSDVEECYKKSPNLLNTIFTTIPGKNAGEYSDIINFAGNIFDISELDTARYAIEKYLDSSLRLYDCRVSLEKFKEYNLDLRRTIDYLFFDLYKQGKRYTDIRNYIDYLNMCMSYEGKIRDKYPKHLDTAHRIIALKVNEKAKLSEYSPIFAETMSEAEDFTYQNPLDKFKIVMPKESKELIEEGSVLGHCVASYIEKVNAGDCIVVFMREKENIETPYLTVEILPDRTIPQVEGLNKRSELTEDEILFLNRWAKNKNLKITAQNAIMDKKKLKEIA